MARSHADIARRSYIDDCLQLFQPRVHYDNSSIKSFISTALSAKPAGVDWSSEPTCLPASQTREASVSWIFRSSQLIQQEAEVWFILQFLVSLQMSRHNNTVPGSAPSEKDLEDMESPQLEAVAAESGVKPQGLEESDLISDVLVSQEITRQLK